MRRLLIIFLSLFALLASSALAVPSIDAAGVKIDFHKEGEFTMRFPNGLETKTLGDPQVHFGGSYFFWPGKRVSYVFPRAEIVAVADKGNGYTSTMLIFRNGKIPKCVYWKYDEELEPEDDKARPKTFDVPKLFNAGIWGVIPLAEILERFVPRGVKLVWKGKKGWKRGDGKKLRCHRNRPILAFHPATTRPPLIQRRRSPSRDGGG